MKVITKLKIYKSPGPVRIHNLVLYELRNEVVPPLTKIFSKSLTEGCIPNRWKEAEVTPIYIKREANLTLIITDLLALPQHAAN